MTAQEIRTRWDSAGNYTQQNQMAGLQVDVTAELAAQVAELNESRKPRWVNLSKTSDPWLVDAAQVTALHPGYIPNGPEAPTPCVYLRFRGTNEALAVTDFDHDEVRAKLGIDEDWLQQPRHAPGRHISESDYAEMTAIIDTARKLVGNRSLVETSTGTSREEFNKLDELFDSFDAMPF